MRPVDRRRVLVVNEGAAAAAVVSLLSLADPWAAVAAMALLVALPFVAGARLRRAVAVWIAVAASGALAMELAAALALPTARLQAVLLAWSGVAMIGGLALDARRTDSAERRRRWTAAALLAPVVLGAIALVTALTLAVAQGVTVTAWSCLAAAGVVAAVAVLAGASFLTGISWTLLTVWAAALSPWPPQDVPWIWVVWTATLLAVAELLVHVAPPRVPTLLRNWALPAAVVAHGTALVGLGQATSVGGIPATWCGIGGLAILFGIRVRRVEWPVVGTALVLAGTAVAGPGWLALALLATSITAAAGVTRTAGAARTALRVTAGVAALGAWASFGTWQDWDVVTSTAVTTIAAGGLIACAGIALRARLLDRPGAIGVAGPALAALAVVLPWWIVDGTPRSPSGFALVGGTALVAVGFAVAAGPAGWRWLREASALTLVSALLLLLTTVHPTAATAVGRLRRARRARCGCRRGDVADGPAPSVGATGGHRRHCIAGGHVGGRRGGHRGLAGPGRGNGDGGRPDGRNPGRRRGPSGAAARDGRRRGRDLAGHRTVGRLGCRRLRVRHRDAGRPVGPRSGRGRPPDPAHRDWSLMALVPGCAAVAGSTAALALPAVDRGVAGIWVAGALGTAAARRGAGRPAHGRGPAARAERRARSGSRCTPARRARG